MSLVSVGEDVMNRCLRFFVLVVVAAGWGAVVGAVPPLRRDGVVPPKHRCRVNVAASLRHAEALRVGGRFAPGAPPVLATPPVVVLAVDFTDTPIVNGASMAVFFQSVRDYYLENSYGVFAPTFTITSTLHLPNTLAYYGADQPDGDPANYAALIADVKTAVSNASLDLTPYVEMMIYHAGYGEESTYTGNPAFDTNIWSVYYPGVQVVGGRAFNGYTVVPDRENGASALAVICHEYGHQLGLPDLYDTGETGGSSVVGAWDLMDYPWMGSPAGANPPHLGAWTKKFLGFGAVRVLTSSGTVHWEPAEAVGDFTQLNYPSSEYFMMEHRSASVGVYDADLPQSAGAGLAVWHVDDSIALNASILSQNAVNTPSRNGRGRAGVQMVAADGVGVSGSDVGWNNGFTNGTIFSSPKSDLFSGAPSGLTVSNIAGVGSALASADVFFFAAGPSLGIQRVVNYPNPAGNASAYPVRTGAASGTVTTLAVFLSQPVAADKIKVDIFSSEGDPVRAVAGTAIHLQSVGSADNRWVYEYDWDGRSDGGDDVAAGLYLYRFTAGGETKTGRLVIVR
jgi:M6 family metalloprotease-like protein